MQEKMVLCCCDGGHEMRFWAENQERARLLVDVLQFYGCPILVCMKRPSLTICDLPLPDGSVFRVYNPEKKHG